MSRNSLLWDNKERYETAVRDWENLLLWTCYQKVKHFAIALAPAQPKSSQVPGWERRFVQSQMGKTKGDCLHEHSQVQVPATPGPPQEWRWSARESWQRSSRSLYTCGEQQWSSLSRAAADGKSMLQGAQRPPSLSSPQAQPPQLPTSHPWWPSSACKRQFHFSATDSNSNWVLSFKPGQEQLCQPAAMRAIFEENCQTGQEVKYVILKPFLSVRLHVCVHFPLQARNNYSLCTEGAQVALIAWMLRWLLCDSWKRKEKILSFCVLSCFTWLTAMEKTLLLLPFTPSHPRHHLSSCQSSAACTVQSTPLRSLIQMHSTEVIWNIAFPLLFIKQGKTVLAWGHQIRTQIQLSYSVLIQIFCVTQLFIFSLGKSAIKLRLSSCSLSRQSPRLFLLNRI